MRFNHIYRISILLKILWQQISKPRGNWNEVYKYFVLLPILSKYFQPINIGMLVDSIFTDDLYQIKE